MQPEQPEQSEQYEQPEQYEQSEQPEQSEQLLQFLLLSSALRAAASPPQCSTEQRLPLTSEIHVVIGFALSA